MEKTTLHLSFSDQNGNGLTDPVHYSGDTQAERCEATAGETVRIPAEIDPARLLGLWISSTEAATLLAIGDDGEIVRELTLEPRRPLLWYQGIGVAAAALFDRPIAELRVGSDFPAVVNVRLSHEPQPALPLAEAVERYAAPLVGATAEPADLATAEAGPLKPGDQVLSGNQRATALAADSATP